MAEQNDMPILCDEDLLKDTVDGMDQPFWDDADCETFDTHEAVQLPDQASTLASIPLLWELGLRLYCLPEQGYVLSTGKEQVLGIVPSQEKNMRLTRNQEGVSVLYFPQNDIVPGKLEPLLDCVERFFADGKTHRPDPFRLVPPELHGKMAMARLIEPGFKADGVESFAWELTPFGKQYGLVPGYLPLDGGRSCRTFFIREESWEKRKNLLTEARPSGGAAWEIVPMGKRLERLAAGLPGNDAYGVELLKKLARMPLEQYMARCPDMLDNLRWELSDAGTVQEAAAQISEMWRSDPDAREQCKSLIWSLLAWPGDPQKFPSYERRD